MQRRDFIVALGSVAAAASPIIWPLAARSQQNDRVRRVGVLVFGENNATREANISEFRAVLQKLNWIEGRNLRIELTFVTDRNRLSASAQKMVGGAPDVIITTSLPATRAAQQSTRTIPIVFVSGGDPANNGLVNSITRPEGNVTGFASFVSTFPGKWVELLKQAVPGVTRIAIVFNPETTADSNVTHYIATIETAAAALGINATRTPVRDAAEIAHAIGAFAGEPNGSLFVLPPPFPLSDRALIYGLAVAHRLPAIYHVKEYAYEGALLAYAPSLIELWRGAASYVDRILVGAKTSDLPVQFPIRYTLVVNLRTAKAMGLTIPNSFLLRADEVIE